MAVASPLVSFVVPVYNAARFLRASLDSALAQTYPQIEVIVVDDGSHDDTPSILAEYSSDPRVRVEHQEHLGFCAANERGRALARGELIARHDGDDIAVQDRIAKQVAFLAAHPEVVAVGGATELIDETGRPFSSGSYPLDHDAIVERFPVTTPLSDPTTLIRSESLAAVGGWRTTMSVAGDYDLWLRLAEVGRLANLPDTLVRYRIHRSQDSGSRIRECAYTSLAAFAASKRRAAGLEDPLVGVTTFDADLVRRLGVRDDAVADFTLDLTIWWAKLHERAGNRDVAHGLWRQARELAAGDRDRLHRVIDAQRRIRAEQGRRWRARVLRAEELVRGRRS